jgi:agmatine deiminase
VRPSLLTNEGGGLHVDGAGTVLLTDTVQLDPQRNLGWTRELVEAEVHAQLGTSQAVWLPRGLTRDYDEFGTRGHVDIVATFVRPGVVAAHVQRDRAHPDFEVTQELLALLRSSVDAAGRTLDVVEIPAPSVLEVDGDWVDYSYINHYVGNGFVLVGTFDDPVDAEAVNILARLYPNRRIETTNGRAIFAYGGGVHCITQQQPRARR